VPLELPLLLEPMFGQGPLGVVDWPLAVEGVVVEGVVVEGVVVDGVAGVAVVPVPDWVVVEVAVVPVEAAAPLMPAAAPAEASAPATIAAPASLRMCTGFQLSFRGWMGAVIQHAPQSSQNAENRVRARAGLCGAPRPAGRILDGDAG